MHSTHLLFNNQKYWKVQNAPQKWSNKTFVHKEIRKLKLILKIVIIDENTCYALE